MLTPFDYFALTVVALFVKMAVVGSYQGYVRSEHDQFARPEDAELFGSGDVAEEDPAVVDRAQRALRNDVENIPLFLFLALAVVHMDVWPAAVPFYFGIYVFARVGHSVSYIRGSQPARTIFYGVGKFVALVLAGHLLFAVFGA